jgi:hypothetical protein
MIFQLNQKNKPFLIRAIFFFATLVLFLFAANIKSANAQNQGEILLNESFRDQPLQDFIDSLESKYNLRIFCKQEWIAPFTISKDFRNTPLIQALNNIFVENNLTFQFFQNNAVVIFPEVSAGITRMDELSQTLIIGNPLNLGRYKSALFRGKITDGKTGDPLPGAIIYHTGSRKGTTADKNGEFELLLPAGDHQIQFSFTGLESTTWKIRLIEDGYEEFELFEESHAIEEVTVYGKEADLPRSQMGMVQMSTTQLKQLPPLMGEVDVLKGMTMLPGVQSVGELSSGINVRGGNTDQNLILIGSGPVFNSSHLFGFLSLINPDVVDNVRLFKGGIPAKYGERVASVMEVGLKDGNNDQMRFYGGIGLINSRLTIDGPVSKNKKLTLVAGARSSYTNWILKNVPELDLARSVTHFYDFSGKLTWKFDNHNRLSFMGYLSNDEFSTSSQSVTQYGNILTSMELNSRFSEQLYSDLEVAFSRYDYRLTDYAYNNPQESYFLDNLLAYSSAGYKVRWHPNPVHKVVAGFKAISYYIEPGKISPVEELSGIEMREMKTDNAFEFGFFADDEIALSPVLSVYAGLRLSYFSNRKFIENSNEQENQDNWSAIVAPPLFESSAKASSESYVGPEPRLSLRYDISRNRFLKFNYQRVRQHLFQFSNSAVISPAESWRAANSLLKPLISDQVALGIDTESIKSGWNFSSEIYFKYLQNLVEYKNGSRLIMNEKVEDDLIPGNGFSTGIELSARKDRGRLTGYASYVFSRTMQKVNSGIKDENLWEEKIYPSMYDKPHDLSLVSTYNISRRWRFSTNFVFISGRPVTLPEIKYPYAGETLVYYSKRNKYRMPPYHRLDLSVTFDENLRKKRMWKGSWTLSVYNVYGRENPYSIYYRKSEPGSGNDFRKYALYKLSVIGIPVPSLTYNFKF